ncbi:MAG: NAD-dependent epimerase/dehydratase family protein [Candidatus Desulforudis sp.]|nr:NAD-dependent epimerase/dehydratase family protein [Bacillota bacterium]MBU4554114.1 NAD-dependent epimerase/dehydratase family protein [Bacillota bacterium]MBV1727845.1 NAD-dependent epimerase/dehydratase family protein [Desulforudis sp.]MBV1734595.1 NAD-dependent epimerase/dehydratase family protein [Desulforudis sp.]MBV1769564.1 NAD-dependent epimerase/dehydratase family protein [Desulforudis sp.]
MREKAACPRFPPRVRGAGGGADCRGSSAGAGKCVWGVRDYIHVTDLAQAHILALEALESGGGSAVYNLGNEQGHSVREVIDVARRVTGVELVL